MKNTSQNNQKSGFNQKSWQAWVWAGWETDRHYRRVGRSGTPYFGRGHWLEAWRNRLQSRETIKRLADTGLNVLVTHFYKGFGIKAESEEWKRLEAFVELAHDYDLRVLGYMQGGSIYYESLLSEEPDAMDWAARHRDSTVQTWGGSYYRLRPCLTSEAYLAYMRRVVHLAYEQIGLDGIHIDNSYYRHCWCDRCAAGFRQWLSQRDDLDERMGIDCADHIQPPPLVAGATQYTDPLMILWMQYGCHVRNQAYSMLTSLSREVSADSIMCSNSAFPRRSVYLADLALDLQHEARTFDLLFAENGNLPAADSECLVSQAEAYLYADALGYQVLNTAWNTDTDVALSPQTAGQLWSVMAEEFSYHAAVPGNNWWLRPAGEGEKMLMDNPQLSQAYEQIIGWFKSIHEMVGRHELAQWAEVALYIQPLTLSLAWQTDRTTMRAALAALMRLRVPVVLVFAGEPVPESVQTLLVIEQSCLHDADMKDIAKFATKEHHRALVMGKSGQFDEWFIPRNESDVLTWRKSQGVKGSIATTAAWCQEKQGDRYMSADVLGGVPLAAKDIAAELDRYAQPRQFIAHLPEQVMVNVESSSQKMVIHLRDQTGLGHLNDGCQLRIEKTLWASRKATWLTPDNQDARTSLEPVPGDKADSHLQLNLPNWRHYAAIMLESV